MSVKREQAQGLRPPGPEGCRDLEPEKALAGGSSRSWGQRPRAEDVALLAAAWQGESQVLACLLLPLGPRRGLALARRSRKLQGRWRRGAARPRGRA